MLPWGDTWVSGKKNVQILILPPVWLGIRPQHRPRITISSLLVLTDVVNGVQHSQLVVHNHHPLCWQCHSRTEGMLLLSAVWHSCLKNCYCVWCCMSDLQLQMFDFFSFILLYICRFNPLDSKLIIVSHVVFGQLCSMAVRPGPQSLPIYNGFAEMTVPWSGGSAVQSWKMRFPRLCFTRNWI